MKPLTSLAIGLLIVSVGGCGAMTERPDPPSADTQTVNAILINSFNDSAINGAIVAQHTLYPYHFEPGGSALNELGHRDLRVLAANFKERPGQLNVRRGDAPQALYEARVAEVTKTLVQSGVARDRMMITNGLPGGEGVGADRVLNILEREKKGEGTQTYTTPNAPSAAAASIMTGVTP